MTAFAAYTPTSWTRIGLEAAGYEGFVTFAELRANGAATKPGIYVVVRENAARPTFLPANPAGKTKSFTESIDQLETQWVDAAEVVYIGLATYGARRDGIHRRLKQYRRTGAGTADNHGGGVWIFQLADVAALRLCWRVVDDEPDVFVEALEHDLIADFAGRPEYGQPPFANRRA